MLLENQHLLPSTGHALDLACGQGANALFLAHAKLDTHAWDFSSVALEQLSAQAATRKLDVHTLEIDLETEPFPDLSFDLIVVSNYLYRPLCDSIFHALKPGGLLFYQTFCREKVFDQGPSSARFLLDENELLTLFPRLRPVVYREERLLGETKTGFRNQAMLVAQKPETAS